MKGPYLQLTVDRTLGQKCNPEPCLDHLLGRLDAVELHLLAGHDPEIPEESEDHSVITRVPIEEHQRLIRKLVEREGLPLCVQVARWDHENELVLVDDGGSDVGAVNRSPEADLGLVLEDHLDNLVGVACPHHD